MSDSQASQLIAAIASNNATIEKYLKDNDLPVADLSVNGPLGSPVPNNAPPEIQAARVAAISDLKTLTTLLMGPREHLLSFNHNLLVGHQAVARYGIATKLGIHELASFEDLAKRCGLNTINLRRLVRHAIAYGVFVEPQPGLVGHNAVSRLLAENEPMRDYMACTTEDMWPAALQTLNALDKYPSSEEPNETGYALAYNTKDTAYVEIGKSPVRAKRFGSAMTTLAAGSEFDPVHLVRGFDWASLGKAHVVDLGGSHGLMSQELARVFPQLTFESQDLQPVIDGAPPLPADVKSRVNLTVHDFFTEQKVGGADVYMFRWTLHNWADKHCVQILRTLIPALKPGARVIISDNVLPRPGSVPCHIDQRIRSMDLVMLEMQNAHERELQDWKDLFKKADERLEFKATQKPAGSALEVMEFVWTP